jgi:hypothetical protein
VYVSSSGLCSALCEVGLVTGILVLLATFSSYEHVVSTYGCSRAKLMAVIDDAEPST